MSADQPDGAAPFAAMVLEALRVSGGDITPELIIDTLITDLPSESAAVIGEDEAEENVEDDMALSEGSLPAGESGIADGSASDAAPLSDAEPDRLTIAGVVTLGISGDASGSAHIASRHIASEAADVVLSELRSILDTSKRDETATSIIVTVNAETFVAEAGDDIDDDVDDDSGDEVVDNARNEYVDRSFEKVEGRTSGGSSDRPVDRLAPAAHRTDAPSRANPSNDAARTNVTSPDASNLSREAAAPGAPAAEVDVDDPKQEQPLSETPSRTAPEVIAITRSTNRQATQSASEEEAQSAPTEKVDLSGKAVRPDRDAASDKDAFASEFRAIVSAQENGRPIASTSEEFFETENVSVEEVSQAALSDGLIQEQAGDARPVEGRALVSAELQSDRAQAARDVTMPRAVVSAAWLRAMMEQGLRVHNEPAGWNSVTMRLGDEDGTMTVRTRREDGTMAVQLAFSDPNLRITAAQNVDRLEAALRSQYDTAIDFSLSDSDSRPDDDGHRPPAQNRSRTAIATDHETRDITSRSPWARNEWVV